MTNFDMVFNNLTTIELITQANDGRLLSHMDQGDMKAMIRELSDRLEDAYYLALHKRHDE